ncbi:hypothetical protein C8R43DRAFT_961789 [Mycena crocata]|nr:hypothetical protein C8R43DRAFT_961789 [Mycena crocata]
MAALTEDRIQALADLQTLKLQYRGEIPYTEAADEDRLQMERFRREEPDSQRHSICKAQLATPEPASILGARRDVYKDYDVLIAKGAHKGLYGRVRIAGPIARPPALIPVRYLKHEHSGLSLEDAVRTEPSILAGKRSAREQLRVAARENPNPSDGTSTAVVPAGEEWEDLLPAPTPPGARTDIAPPTPAESPVPEDWLRQKTLRGAWLDVRCVCPDNYYGGQYNNRIGVIEGVPGNIKSGDKGVIEVKLAPFTETTIRKLKVKYLRPVITTELPGIVPLGLAKPINAVDGVQVVVIGLDCLGRGHYIGKRGWVTRGGIQLQGADRPMDFPIWMAVYHEWEGKLEAPIDVEVGSSSNPLDLDEWLDALSTNGPPTTRNAKLVKEKGPLFECGICLETMYMPVMPLCMHPFCYGCLYQWFFKVLRCPYCTTAVTSAPIRDNGFEMALADAIAAGMEKNPNQEGVSVTASDAAKNALADAELYERYNWEVVNYKTTYTKEYATYEPFRFGNVVDTLKPPLLSDVFGVVRGTKKDNSIVLGNPRWHSEGAAGSTLTVKYHQQLGNLSRGMESLSVPAFLDNEEIILSSDRFRQLPVGTVVIATATFFETALSGASDHAEWAEVDNGWLATLEEPARFRVWGIWRGRTRCGAYLLGKPNWRKYGAVGRDLEVNYDMQGVALARGVEEHGLGASHGRPCSHSGVVTDSHPDDDDIYLHVSEEVVLEMGTVVSAVVTFTLLNDLSLESLAYKLEASAVESIIDPSELA